MRSSPWPITRYERISQTLAILGIFVSGVALVGWFTGSPTLKGIRPGYIPMAPNTALVFIVLSTILVFFRTDRASFRIGSRITVALATVIVAVRLSEYATGHDLSVDRWLFRFPAAQFGLAPVGKMAFFTASTFLLLGSALFFLTFAKRWTNNVTQALALLVTFIGLVFSLGYVYGNPLTYDWYAIPMALNTAIAFMLCGVGTIARASVTNIVARRHADAVLRESEERYRLLFESNPLPIWVFDETTLAFLAVNEATVRRYGYSREEFSAMTLKDIRPAEDIPALLDHMATMAAGTEGGAWKHRTKGGALIDVEVTSHPLMFAGKKARVVLANDVTERKRAEQAIKKLNENLAQRSVLLEQANKELEAFSYSVSHDLRAPLRAIDGFSRILVEDYADRLDEEGTRVLNVIRTNTQNMGKLIDDLLAFSRLSRKQMEKSVVDMDALAHAVADEIQCASPGKAEFNIEMLGMAQGDQAMLRQVFLNLLSNAAKYSRGTEAPTIKIGSYTRNGESIYYVKDNGVGFDMNYVDKLFGVFQRLHTPDEFEGTGVGLAIVQRIIQRHGGRVWAEGKVNDGATFYFSLPREQERNGNHGTN